MMQSPHYDDLIHDKLLFRLLVQVHLLDHNRVSRPNLVGCI
jgi:hypothetical protein